MLLFHSIPFDLASSQAGVVAAQSHKLFVTDLTIELPPYTYGHIAPRSGLAVKRSIDVGAGVVDQNYQGDIRIVIFNHGKVDFRVCM